MKNYRSLALGAVLIYGLMACSSENKNKETKMVNITEQTIQSQFAAKPDASINLKAASAHYKKYPERWNAAFKFLIESDLENMDLGRKDLSDDVYVTVSEYETKNPEDCKFESHRQRIDLQYLVSGEELIGLTNEKNIEVTSPYSEEKDIAFYHFDGGKVLHATPAHYFIFFPDDKHRPCIKAGDQGLVRKVVVKIKYE